MEQDKPEEPRSKIRPFNVDNPDWRKEYYLQLAALVALAQCLQAFLSHEKVHENDLPPCFAGSLLKAVMNDSIQRVIDITKRIPEEYLKRNGDLVADLVEKEREADVSTERS